MKNFRMDFADNMPSGEILEVLSGRYVATYSKTAITYDPATGKIISILVTASTASEAAVMVAEAANMHINGKAQLAAS